MQPRPEILPGQVIRVSFGKDLLPEGKKLKEYRKAKIEARGAGALDQRRPDSEICARIPGAMLQFSVHAKLWLRTMATALRKLGVPVAIQSERDLKGDIPAYAWLTALCTIMSDPCNSYEIVGVLREIFGISDHDLALFSEGDGARFRIDRTGNDRRQ